MRLQYTAPSLDGTYHEILQSSLLSNMARVVTLTAVTNVQWKSKQGYIALNQMTDSHIEHSQKQLPNWTNPIIRKAWRDLFRLELDRRNLLAESELIKTALLGIHEDMKKEL